VDTVLFSRLLAAFIDFNKSEAAKDKYFEYLRKAPKEGKTAFMSALIEESERHGHKFKLSQQVTGLLVLVLRPEITEFMNREPELHDRELPGLLDRLCLILKFSEFS